MLQELNEYGKILAKKIYFDNKEFFGVEDDLFLFRLTEENFIFFTEKDNDEMITNEENRIMCNLNNSKINHLQTEEKIAKIKKLLPYEIFSMIIKSNEIKESSNETQEFADFLTKGLIEIYTRNFSERYNIEIEKQYEENKEFAEFFLNNIPDEMDKDRMVFQNDAIYMAECFELKTKKNLYTLYEKKYKKEQEKREENSSLTRKKNGFLASIFIIISCLILGVVLGSILIN